MSLFKFRSNRSGVTVQKYDGVDTKEATTMSNAGQNLLAHIPGEASGFYLMAVEALNESTTGMLAFLFMLAFVLLIVVRWVANASKAIFITSTIAFLLWMFVLEDGFLRALFPDLLPDPMGLIIAAFYSALITVLATAGKFDKN